MKYIDIYDYMLDITHAAVYQQCVLAVLHGMLLLTRRKRTERLPFIGRAVW